MQELTFITTCKGRLSHLKETLPCIAKQPNVNCIVVDYGCPERCGDWVEAQFPNVKVVRSGPVEGFNTSRARNLGATVAQTSWLGFFDADILLDSTFTAKVVPKLEAGRFYRGHPVTQQTWGSLICLRSDFEAIGGYDEAYTGWGGEDDDLIRFLSILGRKQTGFPAALLNEIPHTDALRTRFFDIQDRWIQSQINQVYLQAKIDTLRLLERPVTKSEAVALFSEIKREITSRPPSNGQTITLSLYLPSIPISTPPVGGICQILELRKTLNYSLQVKGCIQHPGTPVINIECI